MGMIGFDVEGKENLRVWEPVPPTGRLNANDNATIQAVAA